MKKKVTNKEIRKAADRVIKEWKRYEKSIPKDPLEKLQEKWDAQEKMEKKHPRGKTLYWFRDYETHTSYESCEMVVDGYCIPFIDAKKLDKKQYKAIKKWIYGQTCPLIPGYEAVYAHDYSRFYHSFVRGETATIND